MPKSLRNNIIPIILISLVIVYALMAFARPTAPATDQPTINTLVSDIKSKNVKRVQVSSEGETVKVERIERKDPFPKTYTFGKPDSSELTTLLKNYGVDDTALAGFEYSIEARSPLSQILPIIASIGIPIILLVFFLFTYFGGDPAEIMGGLQATPEQIESMRNQLGLNKPVWEQLWLFVTKVATFHWVRRRAGNTKPPLTPSPLGSQN